MDLVRSSEFWDKRKGWSHTDRWNLSEVWNLFYFRFQSIGSPASRFCLSSILALLSCTEKNRKRYYSERCLVGLFNVGHQNEAGMTRLPVTRFVFLIFRIVLLSLLLFYSFLFFGRAARHVGSELLDQGLNPRWSWCWPAGWTPVPHASPQ